MKRFHCASSKVLHLLAAKEIGCDGLSLWERSVRCRPFTLSVDCVDGVALKAVKMPWKLASWICLMSAICWSADSQENGSYVLRSLDCDPSRWNAVIPPSAALVSSVCDMRITLSKGLAAALPNRRGNHALHVLLSTAVDQVDISELSNRTSLKGARVIDHRVYVPTDVNQWADSHTIGLQQVNLSLAINLCGPMYLVTVWSYWPSAVDSDNLRPAVLGTLSWPFRVSCETEVDVSLHLQLPSPSKNITLLPGPTISSQLPGMKLHLVHHNSSKSPVLMARTSLKMPQIWIYLRWQPFAYLNQSKADVNGLRLRVGDQLLHRSQQLFNLKAADYFPEVKRGQSIALNLDAMRMQSTAICGEAVLIFHLDPLGELPDANRADNIILLPVFVDCLDDSLMGFASGQCSVVGDEMSLGRRAVMFTAGRSLGTGNLRAYQYKADDKTFQRLYGQDEQLYELPAMFVSILNEQERLSQLNKCPTLTALTLPFQSTLFGHLYNLIDFVLQHWMSFQVPSQAHQQMQWTTIAKALNAVMKASVVYNSPAAYFVDGILNGLFSYWPFFPYGLSSNKTTNVTESWHVSLSKTIQFFLQSSLYSDYSGQPNPSQGFQNFLNQLLWSAEVLPSESLTKEDVMNIRQLLLWALQRQMPQTFDDLPAELGRPLLSLASQIKSPVPVLETEVHSTIKAFRADLKVLMDRLAISSSTTARPVNNSPITSTARPAMQTSTGFPMTKPATTTTRVPTVGKNAVNSSLTDKLIVIDSLAAALDNPNAVVLLTRIFQMVQANVALNKHWIMIEGLSDTSLDANISCRLHALSKLMARQSSLKNSIDFLSKVDLITFWKTTSGVIFRGDVSSITGRMYWNRVAVCNCDDPGSFALRNQYKINP